MSSCCGRGASQLGLVRPRLVLRPRAVAGALPLAPGHIQHVLDGRNHRVVLGDDRPGEETGDRLGGLGARWRAARDGVQVAEAIGVSGGHRPVEGIDGKPHPDRVVEDGAGAGVQLGGECTYGDVVPVRSGLEVLAQRELPVMRRGAFGDGAGRESARCIARAIIVAGTTLPTVQVGALWRVAFVMRYAWPTREGARPTDHS